jgi:hypothetical protein
VHAAKQADLLVVGQHDHGGLATAVQRSMAARCAQRTTCPVVMVPGDLPAPLAMTSTSTSWATSTPTPTRWTRSGAPGSLPRRPTTGHRIEPSTSPGTDIQPRAFPFPHSVGGQILQRGPKNRE